MRKSFLILLFALPAMAQVSVPSMPLGGGTMTGTLTGADSGTWGSGGINGSIIGGVTPAAVNATTFAASGAATLSGKLTGSGHRNATALSGANLCPSATLSGTGWSGSGLGPYTHTSGTTPLTSSGCTALVAGQSYLVTYSMVAGGAANVTPGFGGLSGTAQSATNTYTMYGTATSTAVIAFTPVTGFTGTVTLISAVAQGPAFTSCGTTVVQQGSNDFAGQVTTAVSGCVMTFQSAYTNTPSCTFTPDTLPTAYAYVSASSNSSVTFTAAAMTAFNYLCIGMNE